VTRALGTTVQRVTETETPQQQTGPHFDKVSANGHIAVRGRYEAYATQEMFTSAVALLEAQGRVAITLERGPAVQAGERTLYRVLPVYKDPERAKAAGSDPEHEPVRGDSEQGRAQKQGAYQRSLSPATHIAHINELALHINTLLKKSAPKDGDVAKVRADAMKLALDTMGAGWIAQHFPYPERFGHEGLNQFKALLPSLAAEYMQLIVLATGDEQAVGELMITLPNDCQAAAQQLIGRPENGGLGARRAAPAVGENHYIDLAGAAPDGWQNHFAAVIMRDGGDSLTYEAAANRHAPLQKGKSLGYFALYGPAGSEGSFDSVIRAQNQAYSERSAAHGNGG
jgi:hypothetical protein